MGYILDIVGMWFFLCVMSRIVAVRYGKLVLTFQLCMVRPSDRGVTRIQYLPSVVALGDCLILIRPPSTGLTNHKTPTHRPTIAHIPHLEEKPEKRKKPQRKTKGQENEEMGTLETLLRNSKVEIHSQNTKQSQISLQKDTGRL
jgi:hypothetical protein